MKSFLEHLNEEVLPTVQVADGGLDISKPAVRAAINAAIAGVVSQPAVTPYVVFNRLSKLLAQYHIVLPKRFLEGDKGVEVFEVKQFGHKMGMTDSGEFVNEVPSTHYLFLQYGILSPFGITYAKPVVGGMFKVMARLVDKAELDKLMDMAEITMAEEAEQMQAIAKANAPKEGMHTALGDCDCSQGDSPSTKKAVKVSMKKIDEEYEKVEAGVKKRKGETHTLHRRNPGHKTEYHTITTERDGRKTVKTGSPKYIKKHWDKMEEDKDPCWKGYEMIGMKKKGGRKVPNCVPVEEEQLDELTGKGKLPALKAVYKGDKDYHTRGAEYHAARADRAERRGEGSKAERHMDAGYGHEHKAERAEAKSKRASALMTRAKAHADIKASKAASKSARAEYNEETQIDELSNYTMSNYMLSATDDLRKLDKKGKDKDLNDWKKINRREHGMHRAANKIITREKKLRKALGEEQIDEVSVGKLIRYKSKAVSQMTPDYYPPDPSTAHGKKEIKREKGHQLASKKLMGKAKVGASMPKHPYMEETQIDELKRSTLASYIKKAHVSGLAAADDAANAYHRRDYKELQKQNKTGEKREQGINRAADKLAKEETIAEKAPPGAKYERMVRHIKKSYGDDKDGLTKKEKSIAYATAWKAKNLAKGE